MTPLRRTASLRRSTPLRTGKGLSRGTPIRQANPERQQRKRTAYATKLAAYRRSPTYQLVQARANGQCEYHEQDIRCEARERLSHHHKRYTLRFGGQELPEDVVVLCHAHHALVEARDFPHRRNGRAA